MSDSNKLNKVLLILVVLLTLVFLLVFFILKILGNTEGNKDLIKSDAIPYEIYNYKTEDVNNKENVDNIINNLKFDGVYKLSSYELDDKNGINKIIFYLYEEDAPSKKTKKSDIVYFNENGIILFTLIENLDEINFNIEDKDGNYIIKTQRRWANELYQYNVYNEINSYDKFKIMIDDFDKMNFSQKPKDYKDINVCIEDSIYKYNKDKFPFGEVGIESHITYEIYETVEYTKAYLFVHYYKYQFANDTFEIVGGIVAPVTITFSKDKKNGYIMKEYKEADDGAKYGVSLLEMFPENILPMVENHSNNKEEMNQIENDLNRKIQDYLSALGRSGFKVGKSEKKYPEIREENQMIFDVLSQIYTDYPYFVGNWEKIEDGIRYRYSLIEKDTSEDKDILTYEKINLNTNTKEQSLTVELKNGEITEIEGNLSEEFNSYYKSLLESIN